MQAIQVKIKRLLEKTNQTQTKYIYDMDNELLQIHYPTRIDYVEGNYNIYIYLRNLKNGQTN